MSEPTDMTQDSKFVYPEDLGQDQPIYAELARANLYRMRGDYRSASEQCVAILRRFPQNPTANTLLGDIAAEQGELEAAVQYYELAIDANPEIVGTKIKLDAALRRIKERDSAASAEQLGLPVNKGGGTFILVLVIGLVALVAGGAYYVGMNRTSAKPTSEMPIEAPGGTAPPVVIAPPPTNQTSESPVAEKPSTGPIQKSAFPGSTGPLARVTTQLEDPRSHVVTLSFESPGGEDPKSESVLIAMAAFERLPEATALTIHAENGGKPVFVADVTRAAYEAQRQSATPSPDQLLSNVWQITPVASKETSSPQS